MTQKLVALHKTLKLVCTIHIIIIGVVTNNNTRILHHILDESEARNDRFGESLIRIRSYGHHMNCFVPLSTCPKNGIFMQNSGSIIFDSKIVEPGETVWSVTKEAGADAFPVAGVHGERITGGGEMTAVGAVVELVDVVQAVVGDAQIELLELAALDDLLLFPNFCVYTLRTQPNATELPTDATKPRIAIAFRGNQGGTLTLIADNLLCQHVPTGHQAVGGQGMQRQPSLVFGETPTVVLRVMVPLPLQAELRIGELIVCLELVRLGKQGHLPSVYRFTNTISVKIDTHQRPVVLPTDRLQMNNTSQDGCLLKMIEPPRAVGGID